jgi:long-subunit acyl-CoA synthetase (AMP-forming)
VFEGYGCRNAPQWSASIARRAASGSVGQPLPHVEVRLAEDGEVLIKGSTLLGYLGTRRTPMNGGPAAISASSTRGFLYLKGRKKHQFVTSFGRNVNPEWVESELTQRRHIAQAFVYGEAMPHNHALLWPHRPTAATRNWPPPWPKPTKPCPITPRCIWTRLAQPFTAANGLLTANGRPRREAIVARTTPN